ncbi:MAG: multicopper oxidase domain-containing protein, partial [Candidatus Eremiobacteraeota bacterium]|nr:multicopper oxidase domain-containing protein [Candidatus Eremiobacteraeota bacterium]
MHRLGPWVVTAFFLFAALPLHASALPVSPTQAKASSDDTSLGLRDMRPTSVESDGTKVFSLDARVAEWEVTKGKSVRAWTYEGVVPGPVFRVNAGDKVRIQFKNDLPEPTVVHWHGLPVPNAMDGVPGVTQAAVQPGGS